MIINIDYSWVGTWFINIPISDWDTSQKVRDYIKVDQRDKFNFRELLRYDPNTKLWVASDSSYKVILDLMSYLRQENIFFKITKDALDHINKLESYDARASWGKVDIQPPTNSTPFIKSSLRAYQYTGMKFIEDAGGNALIGLGVGTGKTLVALAWCEWKDKKAIIICPSQRNKTKRSWAREIQKHTYSNSIVLYSGTKMDLTHILKHKYVIINYDLLDSKNFSQLLPLLAKKGGYDTVICDEAHKLMNPKTKIYKNVKALSQYCTHKILMSATAIKNKSQELFTQLNIVMPSRFTSYNEFKYKYCTNRPMKTKSGGMFVPKRSKEQAEMLNRDMAGVYFYRDKYKIIKELPPLTINIEWYDLPELDKYKQLENDCPDNMLCKQEQHKMLSNLMVDNTVDYVTSNLLNDENKKIIVYSGFRHTVEILASKFGSVATYTHGGLSQADSDNNYVRFLKDSNCKIIVATYQSFSESLNLQDEANVVVFNDCPYVPGSIEQAWGRVHRMGQTHPCIVKVMGYENTYFENIQDIVESKAQIVSKVLENKSTDEFLNQTVEVDND